MRYTRSENFVKMCLFHIVSKEGRKMRNKEGKQRGICIFLLVLLVVSATRVTQISAKTGSPQVDSVDTLYEMIAEGIESKKHQLNYFVTFDPKTIDGEQIRAVAYEKGGYELIAKFVHYSWSWEVCDGGYELTFKTGYFNSTFQDKQVDIITDLIVKNCEGMSDYEKIRYVYDYIILHSEYKLKDGAYNNLIRGVSCCNGYAEAFLCIMEKMGIECQYTVGSSHAWNTVKLDGSWYNIDCTWGDEGGDQIDYTYFLKSNGDWQGLGPVVADAKTSYEAPDLDQKIDFPNYVLQAKIGFWLYLLRPILIVLVIYFVLKKKAARKSRKKAMRVQQEIRDMYHLPEE